MMTAELAFFLACIAGASWMFGFVTRNLAVRSGAVAMPDAERKWHGRPVPQWGGLAIGIALLLAILAGMAGLFSPVEIRPQQLYGFCAAVLVILIGGALDDRFSLKPRVLAWFPILAALIVIASGTGIVQVTQWVGKGAYSLVWWQGQLTAFGLRLIVSLPADLLTLGWLLAVSFAMKFMDGVDGLVAGQTVIGSVVIALLALTTAYYQPSVAVLALMVAAAFLGFLPHNRHPARQFLGESGSVLAGFSLGFLAIVSGTKVATALMVLGLPLVDAGLVILGRLRRGVSPVRGDRTHLHFRLQDAGLTPPQVTKVMWLLALVFGLAGLSVQTKGKAVLFILLAAVTILMTLFQKSWKWVWRILLVGAALAAAYWLVGSFFGVQTATTALDQGKISVNGYTLTAELASEPNEVARGLSGRDPLPPERGMLFLFDHADRYPFWMKGMKFPLDIIWIRDGAVVDIAHDLPPPAGPLAIPATYTPHAEADRVLELTAGGAERYAIAIGTRIDGIE